MSSIKKVISFVTVATLALPVIVSAQGLGRPDRPVGVPGNSNDTITDLLTYIINIGLGIVGLIAVAFLVYGGFRYITSGGNEEVAEGAKKTIQNAIIGLIVVILSYLLVVVVINAIAGNRT